MNKLNANQLIAKYRAGNCTEEEKAHLRNWMHQLGSDEAIGLSDEELTEIEQNIWLNVEDQIKCKPRRRFTMVAAAMFLITVGISLLLYVNQNTKVSKTDKEATEEIAAGTNRAILILANGKKINLNDAENGILTEQKGIKITKLSDGQLSYTVENNNAEDFGMNTIETPLGGQYQVNLPDGTKVWLNAASSLQYPVRFLGNERKVVLSGEGYFEVAKNKKMPFKVVTNSHGIAQETEVLGTHFNINAYQDNDDIKTTLLEGSVKVKQASADTRRMNEKLLKPGEQCLTGLSGMVVQDADVESIVAWKNGFFVFSNEYVKDAMKPISRWYNVEVIYKDDFDFNGMTIVGTIPRKYTLQQTLHLLELTGNFKFKIQGRRIIVTN